MEDAGQKLKRVRERLRLKYREVEEFSTRIAEARGSTEYIVSLSRLADIENKGTLPTLFRLYSLCAIYRLEIGELLSWYGIQVADLPQDAAVASIPATHLVHIQVADGEPLVPISLEPGIDLSKTFFLSRYIQRWGKLPLMLLNSLDLKNKRYGFVGTEDWSMYPLISPGALVVIDETRRRVLNSGWTTEFERPIYFMEHRNGYYCCWCTLRDNKRLTVQPHPASAVESETFDYPTDIEIVGQITEIAMTIDPAVRRKPRE